MANEYGMLGLGSADRMDQQETAARRASAMEYARLTPQQQTAYLANNAAQMVGGGVGGLARAGVGYLTGQDTRGTADKARGVQAQIAQALQNVNPEDIDAVYPKLIGIFQQNGMMPEAMQAAEKYESLKNAKEGKAISRAEHDRKVKLDAQNERIAQARLAVQKPGSPEMQMLKRKRELDDAAQHRELTQPEQNELAMATRLLEDKKITVHDAGGFLQVMVDGVPTTQVQKTESPDAKLRAEGQKAAIKQMESIYEAEDALNLSKEALGLINGSTGSLLGAAKDKIYAAFGVTTPGAAQLAQLRVVAGMLLGKIDKLPGPVSDIELQTYKDAQGTLDSSTATNGAKTAAVQQLMMLYEKRLARAKERGAVRPGSTTPRATTSPGVVRWGRDANGNPVRL
jgi:hypothetical protein